MLTEKRFIIITRLIAILLFLGGLIHWLIIFGAIKEETPKIITVYFHSLAILAPLAGFGLWRLKNWGRYLVIFIALVQIPTHSWIITQQILNGISIEKWRILDIAIVILFLIYFNLQKTKELFHHG